MSAPEDSLFQLSLEACRARLTTSSQPLDVVRPCTVGDGIEQWSSEEFDDLLLRWREDKAAQCGLWVPASGAATRMFGFLRSDEEAQSKLWQAADRLAFGKAWKDAVQRRFGSNEHVQATEACEVLWHLMEGGSIPKGLVAFHRGADGDESENAFDAHLALWREIFPNRTKVWFTVPKVKHADIDAHLSASEFATNTDWHLPFQSPSTDTPVLDKDGAWLTDAQGQVVRRPGGHGALLPLLEEAAVPLIVIRNIDNAPSPSLRELRAKWTVAMLSACDAWVEERERLRRELTDSHRMLETVQDWLNASGAGIEEGTTLSVTEAAAWLDRPMRLVGMVRNEGQPGGGPFWVRVQSGTDRGLVRPQIVESIEFGMHNKHLMAQATHFNPVDMVCALRPSQSLSEFVDASRYMKATKTMQGREVTVLEHPGLWNGGMSGWLTRFVEIPSACFQPVKSALDLIDRT